MLSTGAAARSLPFRFAAAPCVPLKMLRGSGEEVGVECMLWLWFEAMERGLSDGAFTGLSSMRMAPLGVLSVAAVAVYAVYAVERGVALPPPLPLLLPLRLSLLLWLLVLDLGWAATLAPVGFRRFCTLRHSGGGVGRLQKLSSKLADRRGVATARLPARQELAEEGGVVAVMWMSGEALGSLPFSLACAVQAVPQTPCTAHHQLGIWWCREGHATTWFFHGGAYQHHLHVLPLQSWQIGQ